MKPILKRLHSPDADVERFTPDDPDNFGLLVQLMIGPEGVEGEESFDVVVCTPQWLEGVAENGRVVSLRHHVLVHHYDLAAIVQFVEEFLSDIEGANWPEVAAIVARLGRWEFEDYVP